ncbi:MAG: hypothetical protein P1U32_08235 [Legionellaceae bacterium]|nr:hypothetical protein [Legionellaceae bacterium]
MSLFECIDMANHALDRLREEDSSARQGLYFFAPEAGKRYANRKQKEIAFFIKIRERLLDEQALLEIKDYVHLAMLFEDLVPEIKAYLDKGNPICRLELAFILKEVALIALHERMRQMVIVDSFSHKKINEMARPYGLGHIHYYLPIEALKKLKKYQTNRYKVAAVDQVNFALGSSGGMCSGMTQMMSDPTFSPYLKKTTGAQRPHIAITRKVYDCQRSDESHVDIKWTTLTRKHFCPDLQVQAKQILHHARKHVDKDIYLSLKDKGPGHACYLRMHKNSNGQQEIWYMDPNYGAYRFQTQAQFIEFYALSLKSAKFTCYQLIQMEYDPTHILSRQRTLQEAWFSILTGISFFDRDSNMLFLSHALAACCIMAPIALPFLLFSSPLITSSLAVSIYAFNMVTIMHGFKGVLGPIHFLEVCAHELGQWVNKLCGVSEEKPHSAAVSDEPLCENGLSMA